MIVPPEQKFSLLVPENVAHLLRNLHPDIKALIRSGLQAVCENPYCGKSLKDDLKGLRSHRVKRFRIIYRIDMKKKILEIVAVGPRSHIYEETFRLLSNNQKP